MFVLERLSDARQRRARIYGEVVGYAMNTDATDFVLPNAAAAGRVHAAGSASGPAWRPEQIDIVSTHATGTRQRRQPGVHRAAAPCSAPRNGRCSTTRRASSATAWGRPGRWSWPATW